MQRAKEIYFKEWDPQHYSLPDNRFADDSRLLFYICVDGKAYSTFYFSNIDRLREFIKNVYVDGRYTGERSFDRPQMVKVILSVLCKILRYLLLLVTLNIL